jgi:hypothetical protein
MSLLESRERTVGILREYEAEEDKFVSQRKVRRKHARALGTSQTTHWLKNRKASQYQRIRDNADMKKVRRTSCLNATYVLMPHAPRS